MQSWPLIFFILIFKRADDISSSLSDTTLLVHFFGKKGKAELNFEDFYRWVSTLLIPCKKNTCVLVLINVYYITIHIILLCRHVYKVYVPFVCVICTKGKIKQ